MPFVIERDEGDVKPPTFLVARGQWGKLDQALVFQDEATAQNVIDANDLRDVIVAPYNEPI